MRCLVCGRLSLARIEGSNLRESGRCVRCGASNRQRQVAAVILSGLGPPRCRSLARLATASGATIYNTEAQRAIHDTLSALAGYRCSEYLSPDLPGGAMVDGVEH